MMQAVIEKGVTADNVVALERLVDLYERMQTRDAEKQFNAAFVKLQSELPVIVASSEIPNRGRYERFEDVMRQIGDPLKSNGFSVSFTQDTKDNRVTVTCHLRHIGGHAQANSFTVRAGGKADSDTQSDCKASTTAKRNALLQALNIVIRQDVFQDEEGNDASIEGGPIDWSQVSFLKDLCKEVNADVPAFLKFAGVAAFEAIPSARYAELVRALEKKKAKR
jgi:hypothetical protein